MIIDVVNHEWQLCYDMIVDQDKHKKAGAVAGPGTHLSELAGLFSAKLSLNLKTSVERRKRRESEGAQLAYRNARSSVRGMTEEIKSELQLTMRQKKHEFDEAALQVQEAKEKLDHAVSLREAHWGPCGMPKRIRTVRKEGWPVGLAVATKHSSQFMFPSAATNGQQSKVKKGDYLRLEGSPATYQLIYNSDRPGLGKEIYLGLVRRWVHFAASIEGLDYRKEKDREIIDSRIPKFTFDQATAGLPKLDRCWTFEDKSEVVVRKLPRLSPYWRLYYLLSRSAKASGMAQSGVGALAGFYEWTAKKYGQGASLFDDDSSFHAWLLAVSRRQDERRASTLHKLHVLVRQPGSSSWLNDVASLQRTLMRLAKKSRDNAIKHRELLAEEARRAKDPLQKWLDSKSQLEVLVMWATGVEGEEDEKMGYLQIDLDCPASLSRMLLARYLWFDLNKKKGLNFFFRLDKEDALAIEKEADTTVGKLVQNQLNAETKTVEYVLTLEPDPDSGAVMEVEQFDWDEYDAAEAARKASIAKKKSGGGGGGDDDDGDDEDGQGDQDELANVKAQKARYMLELLKIRNAVKEVGVVTLPAPDDPDGLDAGDLVGGTPATPAATENAEAGRENLSTGESAEGAVWAEYTDESGYPYWYNESTGESTYDPPNSDAEGALASSWD
jgi:hypothetical protein